MIGPKKNLYFTSGWCQKKSGNKTAIYDAFACCNGISTRFHEVENGLKLSKY